MAYKHSGNFAISGSGPTQSISPYVRATLVLAANEAISSGSIVAAIQYQVGGEWFTKETVTLESGTQSSGIKEYDTRGIRVMRVNVTTKDAVNGSAEAIDAVCYWETPAKY